MLTKSLTETSTNTNMYTYSRFHSTFVLSKYFTAYYWRPWKWIRRLWKHAGKHIGFIEIFSASTNYGFRKGFI